MKKQTIDGAMDITVKRRRRSNNDEKKKKEEDGENSR